MSISPTTSALEVQFPEPMADAAFHGLAGEIVHCLQPHTEASREGLLAQLLVCCGNAIGRTAHFFADGSQHFMNEFLLLVGDTAQGGKGGSWARIRALMKTVAPAWFEGCVRTGLASGEGLINHIRDPKLKGEAIIDEGETEKRLLVIEEEFARVMQKATMRDSILSPILRSAWDSIRLANMTSGNPMECAEPHVSLVGHCTPADLREHITRTDASNGFGNRFLFLMVKRSKKLPEGGEMEPHGLPWLLDQLKNSLDFAANVELMKREDQAKALWAHEYENHLTEPGAGMAGDLLSRAPPHVMRLACIYALLDQYDSVQLAHLQAALAFWAYCERSVRYLFRDKTGNKPADRVLAALKDRPTGLTRLEIGHLFSGNVSAADLDALLEGIAAAGQAHMKQEKTGEPGRPATRWFFGPAPTPSTTPTPTKKRRKRTNEVV